MASLSAFVAAGCYNMNSYQEWLNRLEGASSASGASAASGGESSTGESGGESSGNSGESSGNSGSNAPGGGSSASNIPAEHTVTFGGEGVSSVPPQTVGHGQTLTEPATPIREYADSSAAWNPIAPATAGLSRNPVRGWYTFLGWANDGTLWDFNSPVQSGMTLTAVWADHDCYAPVASVPANDVAAAVAYAKEHAASAYTLVITSTVSVESQSLNATGADLTILGTAEGGIIQLTGSGGNALFTINAGAKLTLGAGITLQGTASNNARLVYLFGGGILVMEGGSRITGNTTTDNGSGVFVANAEGGGTFIMKDGVVSNNHAGYAGGGVLVQHIFRISSGIVYGNEGLDANTASTGAALYLEGGTAEYGTFASDGSWIYAESLSTTNGTIQVSNGVLPPSP